MPNFKIFQALLLAVSLALSGCGIEDDNSLKTPDTPQPASIEAQNQSLAGDQNPLINNQSPDAGWAFYLAPKSQTSNPHSAINQIRCALRDRLATNPLTALGASAIYGAFIGLIAFRTQPSKDQLTEARAEGKDYYKNFHDNLTAKKPKALGTRPDNSLLPDNWFWTSANSLRRWMAHPVTGAFIGGACQAAITGFWIMPTGLLGARFAAAGAGLTAAALTMITVAPIIRNEINFDDVRYMRKYFPKVRQNPVSLTRISESIKAWNASRPFKYYALTEIAPRLGVVAIGTFAGAAIYALVEAGSTYATTPNYCPKDNPKPVNVETTEDSE